MPASSSSRGGRVVVGGQHRDPLAVGVAAWRCRRRSGGGRSRAWCAHRAGSGLVGQSARRRRARPAPRPPDRGGGPRPRAWRAAAGPRASRPAARIDDPVRVGPEAGAGLGDVVGDEQVDALAAELVRRPARATRSRRRTRRGPGGGGAERPGHAAPTSGEDVRRRLELERQALAAGQLRRPRRARGRKSATAAAMTSASAGRADRRTSSDGGAQLGGRSRPGRSSAPSGSGHLDVGRRRASRGPRGRAPPRRSRRPSCPVERLPMKRTGSIGSGVPPAVTTTCRPVEVRLARRLRVAGGRCAGSGARTGRPSTAATTASTICGSSARRPTPDWPDASDPISGATIV